MTAPTMAVSTTPPATMLSKKFLIEGETPGTAASATSGITIDAVNAAAVRPVAAFFLREEACTCRWDFDLGLASPTLFDGLIGMGLKKASELGRFNPSRLATEVSVVIEADAIGGV
ncbi:hypothetical protein PanWU01x14_252260 [Parasponia andersonii]|uniref:Uncharacterized protein n=1 Tax=Parasponia andersonii TaxID=3476 RepID=A0A2P5BC30_PARAD|nr:hypothetical protein PanWU01x14_252260 [Parasponia andersonii]